MKFQTTYDTTEVARLLVNKRNELGLSGRELAAKVGCSNAEVSRIESQKRAPGNIFLLKRFSEELGIPFENIITTMFSDVKFENPKKEKQSTLNLTVEQIVELDALRKIIKYYAVTMNVSVEDLMKVLY